MLAEHDALLVVDVQRDFLPGGALGVPRGDEVVPVLTACIDRFKRRNLPIAASRDWHPSNHCSFHEFGGSWPPHCVAGTAGAELDPALQLPADAKIVDKARSANRDAYSAFDETELHAWLQEHGVKRLFIGGLATDYCVQHSARDALKHGYVVVLLKDAMRAIDPVAGEGIIEEFCSLDASVIRSGDMLDE